MLPTGAASIVTDALLPRLADAFRASLQRLDPAQGRAGLAVSGGPDSMAMLLLAHAAIPGNFAVATVNHGLREGAAGECALVREACAARGIDCDVLHVQVGQGNVQSSARDARYRALGDWAAQGGLSAIATAHHADDQAETLLMRLNRGSGVAGLAGIREQVWMHGVDALVIRPLLHMRRADLAQIVAASGVETAQDPSNTDERFDRVRMRKALAGADWIDPLALSRTASHLAEVDEALDRLTNAALRDYLSPRGDGAELVPPPERIIAMRAAERIIRSLGGAPRGADLARLVDRLEMGEGGNIAGVLVRVEHGVWVFSPEPPRHSA